MQREHAPPGFWPWPDDVMPIEGIELRSAVRTRFFQRVDDYPRDWGRLNFRIQVNKIAGDRAGIPLFRSFYPGIEWNLRQTDDRWFLTAWFAWTGAGGQGKPSQSPARIEGDTVLFPLPPPDPQFEGAFYLRCRVDVGERRAAQPQRSDPSLIVLDDVIDHEPT